MSNICVGLFGTCGESKWRDEFIAQYDQMGINYFNPHKPDWTPADAENEAQHLVNDDIILFPVTAETYGTGSLAETGYSILSALRSNDQRFVIIYISPTLNFELNENPTAYKESVRARSIVLAHLKKLNHPNVFIVDSLERMLALSVRLYNISKELSLLREVTRF